MRSPCSQSSSKSHVFVSSRLNYHKINYLYHSLKTLSFGHGFGHIESFDDNFDSRFMFLDKYGHNMIKASFSMESGTLTNAMVLISNLNSAFRIFFFSQLIVYLFTIISEVTFSSVQFSNIRTFHVYYVHNYHKQNRLNQRQRGRFPSIFELRKTCLKVL